MGPKAEAHPCPTNLRGCFTVLKELTAHPWPCPFTRCGPAEQVNMPTREASRKGRGNRMEIRAMSWSPGNECEPGREEQKSWVTRYRLNTTEAATSWALAFSAVGIGKGKGRIEKLRSEDVSGKDEKEGRVWIRSGPGQQSPSQVG
jgi:hypothetical protein